MRTMKKLLQKRQAEVLSLLTLIFLSLFLYDNYLLMLLSLFPSLVLSFLFLAKKEEWREELEKKSEALSFLESFLSLLLEGWTTRNAYDQSLIFLQEQEKKTYEELEEATEIPYPLGKYKECLSLYLEKDKENQAYLLSPYHAREEVKRTRQELFSFLKKEEEKSKTERLALFLFFTLSVLFSLLFPSLVVTAEKGIPSFLALFSISLLVPCSLLLSYQRLRRWKDA